MRAEVLRPEDDLRGEDFFAAPAERVLGRLLLLFFAAPRAVGRRVDDFFALLFFAPLPRLAPRFAAPFLAPLRFAPARLPPPDRLAPPRDDLARVAIVVCPREGCNGRNRNFRAQAEW
ncbi:MAG TPA: hypothetical protein VG432_06960 [Gemmatimonadaceae bacterium]|nr:hypothetical protein [Gemmatimonadaceae bacterium]